MPEKADRVPPQKDQKGTQSSTYVLFAGSSARLSQARSQVSSAAWKSRCTTSWSDASSSRCTAGDTDGRARAGSLLRKGPPSPFKGAAEVEASFFIASLGLVTRQEDSFSGASWKSDVGPVDDPQAACSPPSRLSKLVPRKEPRRRGTRGTACAHRQPNLTLGGQACTEVEMLPNAKHLLLPPLDKC